MNKKFIIFMFMAFLLLESRASADLNGSSGDGAKSTPECFEKISRATFAFNQALDNIIFEPVSKAYRILPVPIRMGSSNMLSNIGHLLTIPNNILQGDFGAASINTIRFVLNTTIGILGIFDPAEGMGLSYAGKEDYGQTLGAWGMGSGCYFVLPILGPTTVRDVTGTAASFLGGDPWYNISSRHDTHYFKDSDYFISRATSGIDFRSKNIESFDSLEKNSVDFYASIKSLYIQDRENKIRNTKSKIETQDDSDWDEIENQ